MVQDVNVDDDPDDAIMSPASTPGLSPLQNSGDSYFSPEESFSARQRRTGSVRGYSGSILTRRDTLQRSKRKPLERLHTEVLLRMVLQDAQTRLVFRAQALLRADVEYYAPKEGDLEYPEKIKGEPRICTLNTAYDQVKTESSFKDKYRFRLTQRTTMSPPSSRSHRKKYSNGGIPLFASLCGYFLAYIHTWM
jgi:hypothetical protein